MEGPTNVPPALIMIRAGRNLGQARLLSWHNNAVASGVLDAFNRLASLLTCPLEKHESVRFLALTSCDTSPNAIAVAVVGALETS